MKGKRVGESYKCIPVLGWRLQLLRDISRETAYLIDM